jgi:putative ABC transport system permease protein
MIRRSARHLRAHPGFSLAVIASLAIGLAANASVFSILNAIALRPLPYPRSEELLHIGFGDGVNANLPVPGRLYQEWRTSTESLVASATYHWLRETVDGANGPEEVVGAAVTANFAAMMGVTPSLGQFLDSAESSLPEGSSIVLGHGLWSQHFGADPRVVGRSIRLSGRTVTVSGVMPAGFDFPQGTQLWELQEPVTAGADEYYTIVARRRTDLSIGAVRQDLSRLARGQIAGLPQNFAGTVPTVVQLQDYLYGSARPATAILLAAAVLLLVAGCAGVANLVLAHAVSRNPEFALRFALGAPRRTVVVPILLECLLLAVVAGAIGTTLSVWLSRLFVHLGPPLLAQLPSTAPDWRVILTMLTLTFVAAAIAGTGAALQATGQSGFATYAIKGGLARTGPGLVLARRVLVVVQVAIAMLLATGAGLLTGSFVRVANAPRGFDADGVLVASIRLPGSRYEDNAAARGLFDALVRDIRALPGVAHVTYGTPPLGGFGEMVFSATDAGAPPYSVATDAVGPGYFDTYRIPLLEGRAITDADHVGATPVVVINQAAARLIFQDRSPIGATISAMTVKGQHPTIVGVAADVPQYDVAMQALPAAFAALAQVDGRPYELAIRASGDPASLIHPLRQLLQRHDPGLAARTELLDDAVRRSVSPQRFNSALAGTFALLAVSIAAVGLFGLLSYVVTQRSHEIGIRIAIGARPGDIIYLVAREGLMLTGIGIGGGTVLALSLSGLLTKMLVDLDPQDPTIIVAAATLLAMIAVAATVGPAWRAARTDPMQVLRRD